MQTDMLPANGGAPAGFGMPADANQVEASPETCQFISFTLGKDEYAIDIMAVREIKGWTHTTPLPNQSPHVLGVLNLRGAIVPILDLRSRFGQGLTETTPMHVVIIVNVGERTFGILVDAVSDILTVEPKEIKPVPENDKTGSEAYLNGIINADHGMVVVLSLKELFN
ncbi:chemotaxis protein CheW [Roseibium limicola]|uniref:Purine-binding chemotaxis protein CheW n=1 Tax=Roseibium limicola TaxID=2816037 RepID=A0A939J7U2_9HYPH|nr:chemotaxis protein CheW [Roseibium limicola]MBO0346537.1 purine-binding chemotaxis protein CheW [Roseibium limicola]